MYSFGAFGQEHTEDHAAGPLMGGPSDSLQNPPLWGTLPILAAEVASLRHEDRAAASLLLPYLGWCTFATVLNTAVSDPGQDTA